MRAMRLTGCIAGAWHCEGAVTGFTLEPTANGFSEWAHDVACLTGVMARLAKCAGLLPARLASNGRGYLSELSP